MNSTLTSSNASTLFCTHGHTHQVRAHHSCTHWLALASCPCTNWNQGFIDCPQNTSRPLQISLRWPVAMTHLNPSMWLLTPVRVRATCMRFGWSMVTMAKKLSAHALSFTMPLSHGMPYQTTSALCTHRMNSNVSQNRIYFEVILGCEFYSVCELKRLFLKLFHEF